MSEQLVSDHTSLFTKAKALLIEGDLVNLVALVDYLLNEYGMDEARCRMAECVGEYAAAISQRPWARLMRSTGLFPRGPMLRVRLSQPSY